MSPSDPFGPRLRTAREGRGISLQSIAEETKVSVALWEAMERNDFTRWPSGLFARSYVRAFARLVGLDPEEVVDEFCRRFPNGDRRVVRLIRGQAEIIGIPSNYCEDQVPPDGERRRESPAAVIVPPPAPFLDSARRRRLVGILGDLVAVGAVSLLGARLLNVSLLATVGAVSMVYYSACAALLGRSAGMTVTDLLRHAPPRPVTVGDQSRFEGSRTLSRGAGVFRPS